MEHAETIAAAIDILKSQDFGSHASELFDRTAKLASIELDREIDAYEVVTIIKCLKNARKKYDRNNIKLYASSINYEAFAYEFANANKSVQEAVDAISKDLTEFLTNNPVEGESHE